MVKKVAIIIERADVALGGAERSMFEVADALSALGLHVDLLTARGAPDRSNIRVLCGDAPGKRVSLAAFGRALQCHLAQTGYDIVHSVLPFAFADLYQPRGGTYAESALRNAASYSNSLLRCWKRTTACVNSRRAELLRAERRLCRGSEGPIVAALSHYVADQLREHYATDPGRIVLTLNGVNIDANVDPDAAARLRSRFIAHFGETGVEEPALYLFAAHNFRLKGLAPLIRAMQIACGTRGERPVGLIVAGAGRSSSYHRLAKRLGVEKHILFLGAVGHVRDALAATDVGVLPTFYDPSSRFILEALAAGKPVITTRFNGATDHFTDGRHGKVIDSPDNMEALADAIRHFANPASVQTASHAIREDDLASRISIRRVAQGTLQLYESILEARGRAHH
ncbi:MAG: glycosyltransferase family 4 protein [Phycisphaerales bacterium]